MTLVHDLYCPRAYLCGSKSESKPSILLSLASTKFWTCRELPKRMFETPAGGIQWFVEPSHCFKVVGARIPAKRPCTLEVPKIATSTHPWLPQSASFSPLHQGPAHGASERLATKRRRPGRLEDRGSEARPQRDNQRFQTRPPSQKLLTVSYSNTHQQKQLQVITMCEVSLCGRFLARCSQQMDWKSSHRADACFFQKMLQKYDQLSLKTHPFACVKKRQQRSPVSLLRSARF